MAYFILMRIFFRKGEGRQGNGSLTYFYALFPRSSLLSDVTIGSSGVAWLTFVELVKQCQRKQRMAFLIEV